MAQIGERPAIGQGRSLFRRLLLGKHSAPATNSMGREIDDLPWPAPRRDGAWERIERLEEATRLLAATLRRTYAQLSRDLIELRRGAEVSRPTNEVREMVESAVEPIATTVTELAEAIRRLSPQGVTVELEPAEDPPDALTELRRSRVTGADPESI